MSLQTAKDVSLRIVSPNASSERRISPSWTLAQFKTKLEPITGIPPSCQKLVLKVPGRPNTVIESENEDSTQVGNWSLISQVEIEVVDTRPPSAQTNFSLTELDSVEKYTMPEDTYSTLPNSVLAWKKANQLGRFNPSASTIEAEKVAAAWREVGQRKVDPGRRCQLAEDSDRRGLIRYVGEVMELPGVRGAPWVGVELDEPVGKNDGALMVPKRDGEGEEEKRYFFCPPKHGVFVRPDRVVTGDYAVMGIVDDDDYDYEEI